MTAAPAPQPAVLQSPAPLPLPPTPRDFDILNMSQVLHLSTRKIAEKHGISQTRVRQVVRRVCEWLAAALPVKTEMQQEQEARLAQHLAAAQLQHQSEQLQNHFDATGDPKYLRQQTRVIAALSRLGIVPGAIDALAADLTEGPLTGQEPQQPWSEDDPWSNQRVPGAKQGASGERSSTPADRGRAAVDPNHPEHLQSGPANPPAGDCSPSGQPPLDHAAAAGTLPAASAVAAELSVQHAADATEDLKGLEFLEQRLLALLAWTSEDDHERRESLESTLAKVRQNKTGHELRITPHQPGARMRISAEPDPERVPPEDAKAAQASGTNGDSSPPADRATASAQQATAGCTP